MPSSYLCVSVWDLLRASAPSDSQNRHSTRTDIRNELLISSPIDP